MASGIETFVPSLNSALQDKQGRLTTLTSPELANIPEQTRSSLKIITTNKNIFRFTD